MASIFERNGKFYGSFQEGGKWVKRLLGETREVAERRLDEIVSGERRPTTPTPFHFPLAVNSYLKKIRVYAKPRSVEVALVSCRLWLDHFSEHPFSRRAVEKFIEHRRKKASTKTVNNDLIILRAILNHAVEVGMLTALPFKVRLLKASRRRVLRILSPEDIRGLLKQAKHPHRGILLVAANTGFRLDEILHLTWRDVFWEENRLAVTAKEGWTTKSYQERSCYVSPEVMNYLREHRNSHRWVFQTRQGKVRTVPATTRVIRKIFQRAGLYQKGVPLTHLIRHSVCSHLLGNGVDIETVRVVMGHASIQTTQGYAHTTTDRMRKVAQALPW